MAAFLMAMMLVGLGSAGMAQDSAHDPPTTIFRADATHAFTDVQVLAAQPRSIELAVEVDGQPVTFFLTRYSLRSDKFELLVQSPDGVLERTEPSPPATFRGVVTDWEMTRVVGSFDRGELNAQIKTADRGTFHIQPVGSLPGLENSPESHVVYRDSDLRPEAGVCGVVDESRKTSRKRPANVDRMVSAPSGEDYPRGSEHSEAEPSEDDDASGSELRVAQFTAEVSFDTDVQFFEANGSSVAATVDDIETIMVRVDDIWRTEANVNFIVNRIVVRTVNDPYFGDDPNELLDQFRDEWESTFDSVSRDIAHLMTGRDLNGSIIGLAYGGCETCDRSDPLPGNDGAYGLSQSRYSLSLPHRTSLTAHEIAHNWDASHCDGDSDCGIMCSNNGACPGGLAQFGATPRAEIRGCRDSAECLGSADNPVYVWEGTPVEIEDGSLGFPYDTLREGLWALDPGGTLILREGTYDADRTIQVLNRPLRMEKFPGTGTVRISN